MAGDSDFASVAALIGNQTRARILAELLGGGSLRASELAAAAGVSRPTASFHLTKLLAGKLIEHDADGGHRAYRLAGAPVAEVIEALQRLAPRREVRSLRAANAAEELAYARFCYDHLAGRLAIELVDAMSDGDLIRLTGDRFELTAQGESRLSELGIDSIALHAKRRSFSRSCLDWSERQPHLAGALGAAVASRFLELGWIERAPAGRAVRLTSKGRAGVLEVFEVQV